MHNIRRNKRVRHLLWTRVLLRFICCDDGDAVGVGAGGREGDLRRRKTVRSRDVWFGGLLGILPLGVNRPGEAGLTS